LWFSQYIQADTIVKRLSRKRERLQSSWKNPLR